MLRTFTSVALLTLTILLSGCGGTTMQDIARKTEKVKTREQLEAVLGQPDKFEKVKIGVSFESMTYAATDGDVNFTVINGKVQSVVTIPKPKEKN